MIATARSNAVALVFSEPATRIYSDDPFFPSIVRGVSQELEGTRHPLVLMLANSAVSHDHVRRYAMAGHLCGVMMVSMHGVDPLPVSLQRMNIPVVSMERPLGQSTVPIVGVDSTAGAAAAVQHLLGRGRRTIATVAGPQDMPAGIDRLAGFQREMRGANRPSIVAEGDFTRESGERAMRQLLADEPALDGVFVASDLMAHGAVRALQAAGRRVPEDVAVVGFDDFEVARYTSPTLTTVRQPVLELGRLLARQLVRLVAGEEIEDSVILDTELVIRDSS